MYWELFKIKKRKDKSKKIYVSYGNLNIINGKISDNVFAVPRVGTQALQWCLQRENEIKIRKQILKYFRDFDIYNGNVDDCFSCILSYFQNPDRVFYKNYLSDSDEYTIGQYVFSNLRNAFYIYKSKLLDSNDILSKTVSEHAVSSSGNTYSLFDIIPLEKEGTSEYSIEVHSEFTELFIQLKSVFETYLAKKRYSEIYIEKSSSILGYIFISPLSEDKEENVKNASKELRISEEGLNLLLVDLKESYLDKNLEAIEIFKLLKDIIKLI